MKNRICSGIMLFCLLLTMPACAAGEIGRAHV